MCFDFSTTFAWNVSHCKNNWSEIWSKMYIGLHVKYPLFLSNFNETWFFSTDFRKKKSTRISNFMKIRPLGGGQTERERERERVMTKLFAIFWTVLRMVGYTLQKSCRNLVCISSDQYCLFPRTSVAWVRTITDCWPTVTGNVYVTLRQHTPVIASLLKNMEIL